MSSFKKILKIESVLFKGALYPFYLDIRMAHRKMEELFFLGRNITKIKTYL